MIGITGKNKPPILKCTQCGHEQDANLHNGLWCDNCGDVRIYEKNLVSPEQRCNCGFFEGKRGECVCGGRYGLRYEQRK